MLRKAGNRKAYCQFEGNSSVGTENTNGGGAIYAWQFSVVTITDSKFVGNNAAYDGGAIYNNNGKLTLTGTSNKALFQDNTAANWGGAVYTTGGTLTADGYTFAENKGKFGGAILMYTASNISNSTFRGNEATTNEGGVIYVNQSASFLDCSFEGNLSKGNGGAILINASGKTITLTGSDKTKAMFTGNKANNGAGLGGAIYLNAGTLTGSGYEFTNNSPDNISRRNHTSAVNNYKE